MKRRPNLLLPLVISAALAIAGGVTSNLVFDLPGETSFLYGLLFFVIAELLLLLLQVHDTREIHTAVRIALASAQSHDRFANYYLALVLGSLRATTRALSSNGVEIAKEDVARAWTDCVAQFETELLVSSFVHPDQWWEKSYSSENVDLRLAKARLQKTVRTLFIWKDPLELPKLRDEAQRQRDAGIAVSHESMQNISSDHVRKAKLARIGTPDFAIIDGNWVFLHFLSRSRATARALVTDNEEIVDACRVFLSMTPGHSDFENP